MKRLSDMLIFLKSYGKNMVAWLVMSAPMNLRRFLFARLADSLSVPLVQVDGPVGSILGSIHDEGMLYPYLGQSLATILIVGFIQQFFAQHGNRGTFLDIGANIGLVTIPIARNRAIQCTAFEPEPKNYHLLNWNIQSNCHDGNVETSNIALWSKKTILSFELSAISPGDHRVQGIQPMLDRTTIDVPGVPLDEIVSNSWIQHPFAIKIDTQGAEVEILRGGEMTISQADLVVLEFWPTGISLFGSDLSWFFAYIGKTFGHGTLVPAGQIGLVPTEASFLPIKEFMAELRTFSEKSQPADQVDVFLRRA